MSYDPQKHHRRSIRLDGYDYTRPGAYFVTLVTWQREALFGQVVDGEMRMNAMGEAARREWFLTAEKRPYVVLPEDEFIVMPNHVHGVIYIVENDAETQRGQAASLSPVDHQFGEVIPGCLAAIVRAYKAAVTYQINRLRQTPHLPVWQRNYYEHIVRQGEADKILEYIRTNPSRWHDDQLHPDAPPNQYNTG